MTSKSDKTSYCSAPDFGSGSPSIDVFRYDSFPCNPGSLRAWPFATARTSGEGSIAVTLPVLGSLAALSANIPPPHPISRYRKFDVAGGLGCEEWHVRMKSWRSGFMRWRRRDEPLGSHHVEASALKCDTSVGLTEDIVLCERNWFCTNRGADRRSRWRFRSEVWRRGIDFIMTIALGFQLSLMMMQLGIASIVPIRYRGRMGVGLLMITYDQ